MTAVAMDRRVIAAVRFLDATTRLPVTDPLEVRAGGVRWIRNLSGYYVIADAPGLSDYAEAFAAPPDDVELYGVRVDLTVKDPAGLYLARRRTIFLPRDPDPAEIPDTPVGAAEFDPANDGRRGSLFVAVDVPLFPAPCAPIGSGWAVVRASVAGPEPGTILAGALIRVIRESDGKHLGSGLSDPRGEVLVAVPDIPVTTWTQGAGPVVTTSVAVRLEVVHDPDAGPIPDPLDLEQRRDALRVRTRPATLISGREAVAVL